MFSLIVPGIEAGDALWPGYGVYVMMAGMLIGALFLDRMDHWLPHEHFVLGKEGPSSKLRKIWLFIIADLCKCQMSKSKHQMMDALRAAIDRVAGSWFKFA